MSDTNRIFGDQPGSAWGEIPWVVHDENDGFFDRLERAQSSPEPKPAPESGSVERPGGPGQREVLHPWPKVPGPRLVTKVALSDRSSGLDLDPGRRLTPAEDAFVTDLVWFGPISDALLGQVRGASGSVASSRTAIRNLVGNPRRHGLVDGYDWSVGGAKARFATSVAREWVDAELEVVEEWSRVEISRHLCRLDAAAFVLPDCVQVVSGRQIRSWPGFHDEAEIYGQLGVRVDVPGVGVQDWVPDLWAQSPGSMAGVAVFVIDGPVPGMVLRPVVRAVATVPEFSSVMFVAFDPEVVQTVSAAIAEVGVGDVCEARLVSLTSVRLE